VRSIHVNRSTYSPHGITTQKTNIDSVKLRFLTYGPRTPGGPRLLKKLNNFSQQINKVENVKKQKMKLKFLKRSVKVKEFEIGG
jgi:hypothetical protein